MSKSKIEELKKKLKFEIFVEAIVTLVLLIMLCIFGLYSNKTNIEFWMASILFPIIGFVGMAGRSLYYSHDGIKAADEAEFQNLSETVRKREANS